MGRGEFRPIVNGNPQVEAGYSADAGKQTTQLQSALVVPLEGLNGVVGVLAMYQPIGTLSLRITCESCWRSLPKSPCRLRTR